MPVKRVTVEQAKEIIVERLREGPARWSELLELGISKATLFRALRELESRGVIAKEGRVYVLKSEQTEAQIREQVAPQVCSLIGCPSHEALANDILAAFSREDLRLLEKNISQLMEKSLSMAKAGLGNIIALQLLKLVLGFQGFAYIMSAELGRLLYGLSILNKSLRATENELLDKTSCEGTYREHALRVKEELEKACNELGISEEFAEKAAKLFDIFAKHGYNRQIKITVFGRTVYLDLKSVIINYLREPTPQPKIKIAATLLEISDSLSETGYRPLGEKEVEKIIAAIDAFCTQEKYA